MARSLRLVLSTPLLWLPLACAGAADPVESTNAGMASLTSAKYADAYRSFNEAIEAMGPEHPQYVRARTGRAEAGAHFNPEQAVEDYLELAQSSAEVGGREVEKFASVLKQAGSYSQAVVLLDRASKLFPEDTHLRDLFEQYERDASKEASPAELETLAGLGYAGG